MRESRVLPDGGKDKSLSDEEILGLASDHGQNEAEDGRSDARMSDELSEGREGDGNEVHSQEEDSISNGAAERLQEIFEANPELRQAWDDAQEYREAFATPEDARRATALIGDLNRMDALFFSRRAEDHAELARSVAALDPAAFSSLAKAMAAEANNPDRRGQGNKRERVSETGKESDSDVARFSDMAQHSDVGRQERSAQEQFFQAANAAAVQAVVDAIQTQVERLLPEGSPRSTRNRVVGEIYRELDVTLRDNRQLERQVREAFRSGSLDASHQRAIVSLITGRAKQALPNVAKKVMNEWTSTILAAERGRRARQRTAEQRVDIVGSGGAARDGRRGTTPRDIDYSRLSDADILNL